MNWRTAAVSGVLPGIVLPLLAGTLVESIADLAAGQYITFDPESGISLTNGNITITITPAGWLDISTTVNGLVLPRLTTAERDRISAPAAGTLIYKHDGSGDAGVLWDGKGLV